MNHNEALKKIKKCLALSKSANQHEAAAALRQAHKLMEAHNMSMADVALADVRQASTKASAKITPSLWETTLAQTVARAFHCRLIFVLHFRCGEWLFTGVGSAPEIAQYAFAVLLRQVKAARAHYIKTALRRCTRAGKTRRADVFCQCFAEELDRIVVAFAGENPHQSAIDAYIQRGHSQALKPLEPKDRLKGRDLLYKDAVAGAQASKNVSLYHGMGAQATKARLPQ